MKKYLFAPLTALCFNWSAAAVGAEFVAVRVEAENFTSADETWTLTSPDHIPDIQPDPDPPHYNNASGNANLELLPDTRVTHDDDLFVGEGGNFWGAPGTGPRIDYNLDIPEAGRYIVYVKFYSTNSEDNGLHVGINGNTPASGSRIQSCRKHEWSWTSGQRTEEDHCGSVTKTIWVDVPDAGVNTITFFAREDGYELDQFLLLKETHDGSLDCFPLASDKIRCEDITTGALFSDTELPITLALDGNVLIKPPAPVPVPEPEPEPIEVDLDIDLNITKSVHFIGDTINYTVKATNNSDQHAANNITASLYLPAGLQFSGSGNCSSAGSTVLCPFGSLSPSATDTLSFTATAINEGQHRIDAQITSDETDSDASNNIESVSVTAQNYIPSFEGAVRLAQTSNASAIGDINQYTATVTNNGLQSIDSATLFVTGGDGLSLELCNPECAVPSIATGESGSVTFNTIATQAGSHTVTAELRLRDDEDTSNNSATLTATVIETGVSISKNDAIVVEAEAFNSSSAAATENAPKWFIIDNNFTPFPENLDPDNATALGVSGSAYVEILPDLRLDNSTASIDGVSNVSDGGVGATLTYDAFFGKAGIYNVYARVRSNNDQDASFHVGVNNIWPESSAAISVCNPDGTWQWINHLSNTDCNSPNTATISIDAPGVHTLMVSHDTDGLELDKLLLSQNLRPDLTGNGPDATSINPRQDASISLFSTFDDDTVATGDPAELRATVVNDGSVTASGLTLTIDGLSSDLIDVDALDACSLIEGSLICSIAAIDAGQRITQSFRINTDTLETTVFNLRVSGIQSDSNTENNSSQSELTVGGGGGGSFSLWVLLGAFSVFLINIGSPTRTIQLRKNR